MKSGTVTAQQLQELMRPTPKYCAKRTLYDGRWYHSKGEADYAAMLDLRKKAGDIQDWCGQVEYPLRVNDLLVCKLIVDFKILERDGSISLVEYKGHETPVSKLKRKLFAALYPGETLTVVRGK